jgi:hypothetical protein
MKKTFVMLTISAVAVFMYELCASFPEISDEDIVAKSDAIVAGKIATIRDGRAKAKGWSIATISVTEVIKGTAGIKEVKLAFPSRIPGQSNSTDIYYELNQEGIWLLHKEAKLNYYLADHPARFQQIENADKIKAIVGTIKSAEKPSLDQWKKETIDKWIADNNLNRYGDPKDTVYMGGTPLFDERTGSSINRYEYIYLNHPEVRKLLVERSKMQDKPESGGQVTDEIKKKIDAWIEKNNLNMYGDPKDTMYTGGTPLFDERTGKKTDRYEYILKKHPELLKELGLSSITD